MSADSWSVCPKCKSAEGNRECSLREDWEIYLDGSTLSIDYCCHCQSCDFIFTYTKSVDVLDSSSSP